MPWLGTQPPTIMPGLGLKGVLITHPHTYSMNTHMFIKLYSCAVLYLVQPVTDTLNSRSLVLFGAVALSFD